MRHFLFVFLLLALASGCAESPSQVQSEKANFVIEQLADSLQIPWGMAFLSDDQLLITERRGEVYLLDIPSKQLTPIKGAPRVKNSGQGGLLDVAVPDDYADNGWIYFTFIRDKGGNGVTVLARAKLKNSQLIQWQDLLETRSATNTGRHFGSRIAFDNNGYLYFGVGDRGQRPNSQNLSNHAGSVMRLYRDGGVPADNPFIERKDARPEIWSYGHRNPQGLTYDAKLNRLWLIEHGPRGGDEINLVLSGRNYGWPVISYGKEYMSWQPVGEGTHQDGMEQPVKQYTPSIAPGSLLLYTGEAFPGWKGNLFAGALKLRHINRITLDSEGKAVGEERLLENMNERIRSLAQDTKGRLYFATDSGGIFVLKPVE